MSNAALPVSGTARAPRPGERYHSAIWRDAVALAILAPSSHNSQPWLFHVQPTFEAVELYADRRRSLPVVDPDDRELVMSCGAALFHLRMALRVAGREGHVELLPDDADRDLLARVHLGDAHDATDEERALVSAMPRRHTTRARFGDRPLPREILDALRYSAEAEGATLELLQELHQRERLADLIADADQLQREDAAFRRELASWIRPDGSHSPDGMPGYSLGHPGVLSYVRPFIVRTFDLGEGQAARDRELATGSPVMAILSTAHDDVAAWVGAGQALARVLLAATSAGVAASFLNQPIEVPALRTTLRSALSIEGNPQVILRMGYGPVAASTPRRRLEDVLV